MGKSIKKLKRAEEKRKIFAEKYGDEISIMQSFWDDLGVGSSFRNSFLNLSSELADSYGKEFVDYEISNLTKLASTFSV